MINKRLTEWSELNEKLPEFQAGFRQNRSCVDNIFVLNSLIQIKFNSPEAKLYAAFVDFKRAFDLVDHSLLFCKLLNVGVSPRLISIMIDLYENAMISINSADGRTNAIKVSRGVLQGERLSPLLFSLFIADLEKYFVENGSTGISIDARNEIHLIAYADDIILHSNTPFKTNKKLRLLYQYCETNRMIVNTQKTKVLIFHKGRAGNIKQRLSFRYNETHLEIVNEYKYLGVIFSETGVFRRAYENFAKSSKVATNRIFLILKKIHINSWDTKINLLQAMLLNVQLYASDLWSAILGGYRQSTERFSQASAGGTAKYTGIRLTYRNGQNIATF